MSETKQRQSNGKVLHRYSKLTGAEIEEMRKQVPVSKNQLARVIGVGQTAITEYLSGRRDGMIPVSFDLAFELGKYDRSIWTRSYDDARPWHPSKKEAPRASSRRKEVADER